MKKQIGLFLAILALTLPVGKTHACAGDNCTAKLNFEVNHIANIQEKVKEKLTYFFKFNKTAKVEYQEYLTEKRLAELSWTIKSNHIDGVEPTASRYTTYLEKLITLVNTYGLTGEVKKLKETSLRHIDILTDLQSNFKYDSGWWLAIQHTININKDLPTLLTVK